MLTHRTKNYHRTLKQEKYILKGVNLSNLTVAKEKQNIS